MKKIISSMFFILVILPIFSQGYADWEKVFSENKKEKLEETFVAVGMALEKSDVYEKMLSIIYALLYEV